MNFLVTYVAHVSLAGDNLVTMLLKPSYTTQDSEKVNLFFSLDNNNQPKKYGPSEL